MKTVNVHQAKTTLSQLLTEVEAGEDVVIARNGTPVARLVAVQPTRSGAGALRHLLSWRDYDPATSNLFAPLTDEEMAAEGWPV